MNQVLSGHVSQETALLVPDYPYGFKLRCQIRYWLEYKPGKGFRFWSQTSNPKKPGLVWNKPKSSTYVHGGAAMHINEHGHVSWHCVHFADGLEKLEKFPPESYQSMPKEARKEFDKYLALSRRYEQLKGQGIPWQLAALQAQGEFNGEQKD